VTDSWSDSKPIGELVQAFIGGLGARDRERMAQAGVVMWWAASVPPEIARHTIGAAMRDGELVVQVDSPVWAAELSAMSEQLRMLMEEATGTGTVRAVRFTVSRRVEMARRDDRDQDELDGLYEPEDVQPIPLTPQERSQVEHAAEQIDDAELRTAFIEAMVTDMELDKGRKAASEAQKGSRDPRG
jgi:Dna[CI] antecedent, DciA